MEEIRYVKTSWADNVKATRIPIPEVKIIDTKGNQSVIKAYSTERCLIEIKDNETEAHYESKYTLKDYNDFKNNNNGKEKETN